MLLQVVTCLFPYNTITTNGTCGVLACLLCWVCSMYPGMNELDIVYMNSTWCHLGYKQSLGNLGHLGTPAVKRTTMPGNLPRM